MFLNFSKVYNNNFITNKFSILKIMFLETLTNLKKEDKRYL